MEIQKNGAKPASHTEITEAGNPHDEAACAAADAPPKTLHIDGEAFGQKGLRRYGARQAHYASLADSFAGLPEELEHPGQLLAAIKDAAPALRLNRSLLGALDWLFKFTQPQDWQPARRPIVWPSNRLMADSLGITLSRVKQLIRGLQEAGLVVMRDSPNGKRYGRRGPRGDIQEAYGFDLSLAALRYDDFRRQADMWRQERCRLAGLWRRLTVSRRRLEQITLAAEQAGIEGFDFTEHTKPQLGEISAAALEAFVEQCEATADAAQARLGDLFDSMKNSPKGGIDSTHINTTTIDSSLKKTVLRNQKSSSAGGASPTPSRPESGGEADKGSGGTDKTSTADWRFQELLDISPALQKAAMPDDNPEDLVDRVLLAADRLRARLKISPALWQQALDLLGPGDAVAALVIVAEKPVDFFLRGPANYFHGMIERGRQNALDLEASLWRLRKAGSAPQKVDFPEGSILFDDYWNDIARCAAPGWDVDYLAALYRQSRGGRSNLDEVRSFTVFCKRFYERRGKPL